MSAITYQVFVDWTGNGTFTDAGDDVTSRVLALHGITVAYGRDQARAGTPTRPGVAAFKLNNRSRDYSPENTSSPLVGLVGPGRSVMIQAIYLGVTYVLYRGRLDDFSVLPAIDERAVEFSCIDGLGTLAQVHISTQLYRGVRTGTAIGLILDEAGWTGGRDLDPGGSYLPFWWEDDTDAATAVERVLNSEGLMSTAFIAADGTFTFRDRHSRLLRTTSAVSQATLDAVKEPAFSTPVVYDAGFRDVINSITYSVPHRKLTDFLPVWTSDLTYTLDDGETIEIQAVASDPFYGAVPPAVDVDYTLVQGSIETSLLRDSGQSTTILIHAVPGTPAVFTGLQLRAWPALVAWTTAIKAEDSVSIGQYGKRAGAPEVPFANSYDARALADITLAHRAQRLPAVSLRVVSGAPQRITQQLTRDLLDRVTIVEPEMGINADFWIEQIQHTFTPDLHETTFGCEKIPSQVTAPFTFDTTARGFNDGVFATTGLSDAANVFTFDGAAGHGFDQGLWAF